MSLPDVVSALRLHLFAEVAFVLAAAGFATVLITTFLRANRAAFERARRLPFEDEVQGEGGPASSRDTSRA